MEITEQMEPRVSLLEEMGELDGLDDIVLSGQEDEGGTGVPEGVPAPFPRGMDTFHPRPNHGLFSQLCNFVQNTALSPRHDPNDQMKIPVAHDDCRNRRVIAAMVADRDLGVLGARATPDHVQGRVQGRVHQNIVAAPTVGVPHAVAHHVGATPSLYRGHPAVAVRGLVRRHRVDEVIVDLLRTRRVRGDTN